MDIQYLKGIGEKRARLFHKLGLFAVEDVVSFYPRAYEDRTAIRTISELCPGEAACFRATVGAPVTHARIRQGMELFKTKVFDGTGELRLTFFNAPYVKNALVLGGEYVFYGKTEESRSMVNPVFEREAGGATGRILPVYRATAGLSQGALRSAARQALAKAETREALPDALRQRYNLCHAPFAAENIHFPQNAELLTVARRRLVFEELLLLQLGLAASRGARVAGRRFSQTDMNPFFAALPFEPTEAQYAAIEDIQNDCVGGSCSRLIQGDVGCGKTVVAAAAAYMAFRNGMQTALMAPTEILAEQHTRSLSALFAPLGLRIGLVTGKKKKELTGIANGEIHLAVGTHALLSESVSFHNLGLVITDEQHRFGVEQRKKLAEKGTPAGDAVPGTPRAAGDVHRIVMSATPIPRTLAQILYGDLDVTLMRGAPPGRTPVKTYVVGEDTRPRIEAFVKKTVAGGGQVYIVCPVIEESETGAASAEAYAEKAAGETYRDLRVGLLHGKTKNRDAVMRSFADGELDILVATTVIEVGVDVPNATLMVVENAERFGLSQLHQLRGRVGRGKRESHCVLFMQSESARERLAVMKRENDGFVIAEEDLRLRGPGDFFGSRQHGLPEFKIADLSEDMSILHDSREAAETLRREDPGLLRPEHAALREAVAALMERMGGS
ncbi:MAG: ATP-dependent DNA helicase RecG [Oscillospiraceae bacterium]|jgi:ATP-dependent DNA helicase RecG|nr:ATP-dependent DNA helicase RecG [Oscillospiraceae bacterium]